jgi:hypothetical protein
MYECTVCQSINHASRVHCQHCGAVPSMYSPTGKCSIVAAQGCSRAAQHHTEKVYLRTVELDYYADGE